MLTVKEKGLLLSIKKHCERIQEKTAGISEEELRQSEDIKEIVCFNLFQIGELAKNLSMDFLAKHDKMPWKNIKGMRDRVAHGYGSIDLKEIWRTATNDIEPLRKYCELILLTDD